jgi:hypothetical protein
MATKIITKNSSTATSIPTAGDLVQGELAVNVTDKRLFTEDSGGAIVELGTNPSTIDINAGTIDGTVIGGTTAAAGTFTTGAFSGAVTADAVAVNTTLKTWDASTDAIQLQSGSLWNYSTSQLNLGQNEYYNGGYKYLTTGAASTYNQASGGHFFKTAVSGSADGAITWVDVLAIDASGNVGIGTSSPNSYAGQTALTINSPSVARLDLDIGDANQGYLLSESGYTGLFTPSGSNYLVFGTNNAERLRIDASGTVKISHADTASEGLRVIQTTAGRTSGGALALIYDDQGGTTQPTLVVQQNGTGDILQLFDGASQVVTVKDGGTLTTTGAATFGGNVNSASLQVTGNDISASLGSAFEAFVAADVVYTGALDRLSGNYREQRQSASNYSWYTGATTVGGTALKMTLDTSGNLLVGAGSITAERNTSGVAVGYFNNTSPTGSGLYVQAGGTTERILDVRNYLGAVRFYITGNGHPFFPAIRESAGSYTAKITAGSAELTFDVSSARYKDNIRDSDYGLSAVMQLQSRMFEYKNDDQRTDIGFIAEEVNEVIPELVVIDAEGRPDAVNYDRMTSVLIKGMQEQQAIIEALTARLEALEGA